MAVMRIRGAGTWTGFVAGAVLLLATAPAQAARDIMLVLDNSGSMRANDPASLAAPAVLEFIQGQPRDTRVGIVVFSTAAALVMPMTPAEVAADGEAEAVLRRHFNYRGQWTQIAAGVERGLYELRSEGRAEATRAIVLMTDGIVDTADRRRDAELHEWLRRELAREAAREEVRIFGVAFTERADFQLLQSLAATTGGEYFRVLQAEGIARAFRRIDTILAEAAPAAPATAPAATAAAAETPAAPAPEAGDPGASADKGSGWLWWLSGAVALLTVAAALGWAFRMTRGARAPARANAEEVDYKRDPGPKAILYNTHERYELGAQTVIIGRAGGNDPERMYIIVPEKTVGRWHATIERRGQTFWVRDEGSVNGTYINDERVIGEQPLKHRDTLRLHNHAYEFEIPDLADSDRTMLSPRPRLVS
jgi:Mg-chelatase subunit ChlD